MAYTVSYSFAGYQAINPDDPLPGASLDTELAAAASASLLLETNLADVRRADGNVQNGKVTWDALSDDVKTKVSIADTTNNRITITEEGDVTVFGQIVIGDISATSFATQTEAEAGVANDRIMTPLRVKQAVDAQRGFASQSETQAGTSTTTVLSPLRGVDLLDAKRAFASEAEAQAGTEAAKVSSPLRVKQAIDQFREAYTGGAELTWGAIAAGASATQAITVPGAAVGDRALIGYPSSGVSAGIAVVAWVSSANTVTVRFTNTTGSSITPYSGVATTLYATVVRF